SWFRLDGGARAGVFAHSANDSISGGEFVGLFAAPALAWRWLRVGPRVSGNLLREHGGEKAADVVIEYVMLRLVAGWSLRGMSKTDGNGVAAARASGSRG